MSKPLNWRLAAVINGFQDTLAYKSEFFIEFFSSAIVPAVIQLLLWYSMFKLGGAEKVAGQSYGDLIAYTWVSVLFSQVRGGNIDFDLAEMIRSGSLSQYLLRPIGAVEFFFFRGISTKLMVAVICLVVGLAVCPFTELSPLRILGAMVLALIGNLIAYQIGAALAASAFVWEEAYSVLMVKNLVVQLLSGELIPLYLVPENLSWIWKSFPFYLYVFGPTQYALGKWTHQEFIHNIELSFVWILVGWALVHISWKLGIKKYISIGG